MIYVAYPIALLVAFALTRIPIAYLNRRLKGAGASWYRYLRPLLGPLNLLLLATLVRVVSLRFGWGSGRDVVILYAATGWLVLRAFTTLVFEWWFADVQGVVLPEAVRRLVGFVLGYLAVLASLNLAADVHAGDLALATGALALVAGLFFQGVLRDLWLGVSISLEKRVTVGDYVRVGAFEGEVIGVDWKSTTLASAANEHVVVPNRVLVETPLVHFRRGGARHRARIEVRVKENASPNAIIDALVVAATDVDHALRTPAPRARFLDHDGGGPRYEIEFWVKDPSEQRDAESLARIAAWYRLRRARLAGDDAPLASDEDVRGAIGKTPLFAVCTRAQIDALAASSHLERFGRGEVLFHQRAQGDALYIVHSGALDVVLEDGDSRRSVATIGAGGFVGERSLMTGEPRSATAIAAEDTIVVVVEKVDVVGLLREDENLASRIANVMAERDAAREKIADRESVHEDAARSLLASIRSFFAL
jgi:small-conductance mechanosensitive channel